MQAGLISNTTNKNNCPSWKLQSLPPLDLCGPETQKFGQGILKKKEPQVELGEILKGSKGIWACSTPILCISREAVILSPGK